jgi:predicted HicB family RNase H-like nuclease
LDKSNLLKQRMIHVRIPENVHKQLRIAVAEKDTSIQEFVLIAILNELKKRNQLEGK